MSATHPPSIEDEIQAALAACGEALASGYGGFNDTLPDAPRTPQAWFELLEGFPKKPASTATLRRLRPTRPFGQIEHFALLQAFLVSVPRLAALPLEESVKRLFCSLCRQVAFPPKAWERHFDQDTQPFAEMAKIATLRRFPAGQLTFDLTMLPRSWLLKIHPLDLPKVVREVFEGMGGIEPVVAPHLFHWRANPMVMLETESHRSLWRIAKSIEKCPEVKGLKAASWFYSPEVGQHFPHLAWLRDFFVENGAMVVDMEKASLDSGFLVGSAKRRQLYQEGKFHPRSTLVLWRREDMLSWASAHPELAEPGDCPSLTEDPHRPVRAIPRRRLTSGRFTLFDGARLLNYHPKLYILLTLLVPGLVTAISIGSMVGWWAAAPALVVTLAALCLFQYFFLQ